MTTISAAEWHRNAALVRLLAAALKCLEPGSGEHLDQIEPRTVGEDYPHLRLTIGGHCYTLQPVPVAVPPTLEEDA